MRVAYNTLRSNPQETIEACKHNEKLITNTD